MLAVCYKHYQKMCLLHTTSSVSPLMNNTFPVCLNFTSWSVGSCVTKLPNNVGQCIQCYLITYLCLLKCFDFLRKALKLHFINCIWIWWNVYGLSACTYVIYICPFTSYYFLSTESIFFPVLISKISQCKQWIPFYHRWCARLWVKVQDWYSKQL
jgi:hypothetical protein